MACSLILSDQGEDDGFFRWIKMASEGFFASKSWAIESVVAERYDADMVNAFNILKSCKMKIYLKCATLPRERQNDGTEQKYAHVQRRTACSISI